MTPLTLADVRPPIEYWPVRARERQRMVELHRERRLRLGDLVSLVFENRETVKGMVEALLCAGWIDSPERIADEVAQFSVLVPAGGELRATLFVAARDDHDMRLVREVQDGLVPHLHLVVGNTVRATAEELGDAGRMPTVHYLRFNLDAAVRAVLRAGGTGVAVVVDHPRYSAGVELTPPQCAALAADLDTW